MITISKSVLYVNALRCKFEIYSTGVKLDKNYCKGSIAKAAELYVPLKKPQLSIGIVSIIELIRNLS